MNDCLLEEKLYKEAPDLHQRVRDSIIALDIMKVRLTLEEALLDYQELFPEDTEASLQMYAALGTIRAVIRIAGERRDPFEAESRSERSLMGAIRDREDAARNLVASYITPVTGAFTGLLCVMAATMCFFAITLGIVRMGRQPVPYQTLYRSR